MKVKVKVVELVEDALHVVPAFTHVFEDVESKAKAEELVVAEYVKHVEAHLAQVVSEVKDRVLNRKEVKVTTRVAK